MTGTPLYQPLDTLKGVADEIWVVDGPLIRFGLPFLKMPFPTRMTIIRIRGDLFIHSPTQLDPGLQREIEGLGQVRWLVAPNRIHYWWIPQWHASYPEAAVYLAPRVRVQARSRIDFPSLPLNVSVGYPWDDQITTLPVAGRYMTEVVFFHRPTRTLVLTDLIENFEPGKLTLLQRALVWCGGSLDPHGSMPRDMRLTYPRSVLRNAVETMIAWNPQRIILAHGRWYGDAGVAELRRAFDWLLE
jgi:hypothetical protein